MASLASHGVARLEDRPKAADIPLSSCTVAQSASSSHAVSMPDHAQSWNCIQQPDIITQEFRCLLSVTLQSPQSLTCNSLEKTQIANHANRHVWPTFFGRPPPSHQRDEHNIPQQPSQVSMDDLGERLGQGLDTGLLAGIGHVHQDLDATSVSIVEPEDDEPCLQFIRAVDTTKRLSYALNDGTLPDLYGHKQNHDHAFHLIGNLGLLKNERPPDSLPPLTDEESTVFSEALEDPYPIGGRQNSTSGLKKGLEKPTGRLGQDRNSTAPRSPKQEASTAPPRLRTWQNDLDNDQKTVNVTTTPSSSSGHPTSGTGRISKGRKRPRPRSYSEESDDGMNDKESTPKKFKNDIDNMTMACPYYRWHPFKYFDCLKQTLKATSYVKQHLRRSHACPVLYCPSCGEVFNIQTARDEHIRSRSCPVGVFTGFEERLSTDQIDKLNKKEGRTLSAVQRWHNIWDICFPGAGRCLQSPYIHDWEVVDLYRSGMDFISDDPWRTRAKERMSEKNLTRGQTQTDQAIKIVLEEMEAALFRAVGVSPVRAGSSDEGQRLPENHHFAADCSSRSGMSPTRLAVSSNPSTVVIPSSSPVGWHLPERGATATSELQLNPSTPSFSLTITHGTFSQCGVGHVGEISCFDDSWPPDVSEDHGDAERLDESSGLAFYPNHPDCGAAS